MTDQNIPDKDQQNEILSSYRDSIDNIDAALIHMLAERFKITKYVGEFKAKYDLALKFSSWMASKSAQKLIGDFRLMGQKLFIPNAK